ncbi:MAG: electron transfer flavoprotein subunit beta/FixA family protein [Actinobacteria bacterium]|nr:electron transfer flavoprotein subunit beta/FixA family protein [Actinomycetota bacterium]
MNIIVTVKQVPDPEAPTAAFRIGPNDRVVVSPTVSSVLSPYDESALEAALQLRDAHGGKVTLVCLGNEPDDNFLHEAMATGADEGFLMVDDMFRGGDAFATAYGLAKAIGKIGEYDLILCGRQASDTDAGVVGSAIAESLGLPSATVIRKIDVEGDKVKVERVIEDGVEVLEVPLPALLTTTSELYTLRYASVMDIMAASEKPVTIWSSADVGADAAELDAVANHSVLRKQFIPVSQTRCEIIGGDNIEEAAAGLAQALRARKVI